IENTDHDYITVDSDEEISALISLLSKQKAFCFDTETTGTDANCCDILGISFAVEPGKAWYVPFSQVNEECVATLNRFKSLFEDENIAKIGQNLKYDILLLSWYGIRVKGAVRYDAGPLPAGCRLTAQYGRA